MCNVLILSFIYLIQHLTPCFHCDALAPIVVNFKTAKRETNGYNWFIEEIKKEKSLNTFASTLFKLIWETIDTRLYQSPST